MGWESSLKSYFVDILKLIEDNFIMNTYIKANNSDLNDFELSKIQKNSIV